MANPPAGVPEPHLTNPRQLVADFQPRGSADAAQIIWKRTRNGETYTADAAQIIWKRTRNGETYTPTEGTGRITTREVWRLIDNLKDIIHQQTTLIEATMAELLEGKHDQNILREQNEKLHEELHALRVQFEARPPAPSPTWAAIAANNASDAPQPTLQRPENERSCCRISTQRSLVDPRDNGNSDDNHHSSWRIYRPTIETDAILFLSLIYVNRNMPTSSRRQIPCDHPDVSAIKIWTAESQTLIFSVYIPPVPLFAPDNVSA
ncbi:hypothetical protein N7520_003758 [Penicillium odoratum]|uniref:uncharacterized protein n=1 Tax=Penicillium odoratum TaxID=1167516 RepID=UPI002546C6B9|nr:uncharacterized protein N7520_003758 [Penicillium odoratum]KAJ5769199.1 hypothetical protein N7520_003758 [Penicillium odoratum]